MQRLKVPYTWCVLPFSTAFRAKEIQNALEHPALPFNRWLGTAGPFQLKYISETLLSGNLSQVLGLNFLVLQSLALFLEELQFVDQCLCRLISVSALAMLL